MSICCKRGIDALMKATISLLLEKQENVILQSCLNHLLLFETKILNVSLPCSVYLTINIVYLYLHHIKIVTTLLYLIYEKVNKLTLQQMFLHINVTCEFARLL